VTFLGTAATTAATTTATTAATTAATAPLVANIIELRVKGDTGEEKMDIYINEKTDNNKLNTSEIELKRTFQKITLSTESYIKKIFIVFTNDGDTSNDIDKNIIIDTNYGILINTKNYMVFKI